MRVGHEASSPKNDIRLINLQYKIGKLIGFNPMSCHKELFLSKLYVFILFFSFLSLTICTITIKYLHYRQTDFLEDLLDLLECLSELLFVSACFTSSSFKKWRRILDLVNLCERKFNQQNLVVKNTTTKWILQIAFYHLLLVALHAFENYLWIMNNEFGLVYGFVSFRIALYYQFFSLTYICSFCQMLKRRYQYLSKLTSEIFENRNGNGNGNNKVYESELMYKLRRVVSIHRSLYVMVQQLNDIFGWQIFLILENIVISLMNSANFALNSLNESNDYSLEERILYSGIYPCIYIVRLFNALNNSSHAFPEAIKKVFFS